MPRQTSPAARAVRVFLLLMRHGQRSTAQIARALDENVRTVRSDLRMLQDLDTIQPAGERRQRTWRVKADTRMQSLGVLDRIALQLGRQVSAFLRGTALHSDSFSPLDGLDHRYTRHLDHKLRLLREPARDYSSQTDTIDMVLDALLRERLLDFHYTSTRGPGFFMGFHPLTLVVYRRALYLMGRRHDSSTVLRLSIDRMQECRVGEPFEYPSDWHPDRELDPYFGIHSQGPVEPVILRFSAKVAPFVRARTWHPSQVLHDQTDGGVELHMHTGGIELERFALEWGQHCEVLAPPALRERVAQAVTLATKLYATDPHPPTDPLITPENT